MMQGHRWTPGVTMTSPLPACCTIAVLAPRLNNSMEEGGSDSRLFLYIAAMSMSLCRLCRLCLGPCQKTLENPTVFCEDQCRKSLHIYVNRSFFVNRPKFLDPKIFFSVKKQPKSPVFLPANLFKIRKTPWNIRVPRFMRFTKTE